MSGGESSAVVDRCATCGEPCDVSECQACFTTRRRRQAPLLRALSIIEADNRARSTDEADADGAAVALDGLVHLLAVRVWVERGASFEAALAGTQRPGVRCTDGTCIRLVIEALCGTVERFDALDRDRKIRTLRYATGCFAQFVGPVRWDGRGRVAWGPDQDSVGPSAWGEVASVEAARRLGVAA